MKKLLKLIALILAFALLLPVLAGCDKEEKDPDGSGPVVHMPTTAPEPFVLPDKEVTLGTATKGVYTNDYLKNAFHFNEKWRVTTAEKLQQLPEAAVLERMLNDDTNMELPQIHVLRAESPTERLRVNMHYQLMNDYDRRRFAVMSEEEIVDIWLAEQSSLVAIYAQENIQITSVQKVSVKLGMKPRTAILLSGKYNGHDHYILHLYDYHLGRYYVTTSLESTVQDRSEQLLDMFQLID